MVAKHPDHKAIAVGHALRKLLHLVLAIWKSGRPFNPHHDPWHAPAHVERNDSRMSLQGQPSDSASLDFHSP